MNFAAATSVNKPVVVDSYTTAEGYTLTGPINTASTVVSDKTHGNALFASTNAGTTTMFVDKVTTNTFVPSRMGVIATKIGVWGKTSGRVINMRNAAGSLGTNMILADSAATPLVRKGNMWIAYDVSDFPNFAALTEPQAISPRIGIQLSGNDGTTTFQPSVMVSNAPGTTKICFTFDDVYASQYNLAFPLFRDRGLVGTIFVVPNNVGASGRITLSQLTEMKEAGWSMCSNGTVDDSVVSTTPTVALNSLNAVRDYIRNNNLSVDGSENHGCWPGDGSGQNWDESRCLTFESAGMLTMRSTTGWNIYDEYGLEDIAMTLPSFSGGVSGFSSSVSNALNLIDLAIKRKSSIHIHLHDVVQSGATGSAINVATLEGILDGIVQRVNAGLCEVVNRTQYWNAVANKTLPNNIDGLVVKTSAVTNNQISIKEGSNALVIKGKERSFSDRITWAQLQTIIPSTQIGRTYFVTDIGINGSVWIATSTEWAPIGNVVLYANREDRAVTNNVTSQQIVDTYVLPANMLGITRSLEVNTVWSFSGSTSTKVIVSTFGASSVISRTIAANATYVTANGLVVPRNSSPLFQSFPNVNANYPSTATGTFSTGSVDTTQPVNINTGITYQTAGGTDTATLRSVEIVLRG